MAAETLDTNGDYICLARDNTEWREQKSSLDALYHDISYMSSIVGMDILRYDVNERDFLSDFAILVNIIIRHNN